MAEGTEEGDDDLVFRLHFLTTAETQLEVSVEFASAQTKVKNIAIKETDNLDAALSVGDLEILPMKEDTISPGKMFWVPVRWV